ncbi:MAG: 50S ribosomal protein L35 [Oscillospiraceae bacterium]|nr:50S ribosomal protein L35 [Oscillospiraceae bacterium]
MKNKIKTHSGAKKRFKLTKSGKIKFRRTNRIHRLTQKATKRKRNSRANRYADKSNMAEIKLLLPYK